MGWWHAGLSSPRWRCGDVAAARLTAARDRLLAYDALPVKLLVLGTSDSEGSALVQREMAWPWLVGNRCGFEVVHKRYYATAPRALEYLERTLEREHPDVVVLSVTLYAFSVRTVGNRVRRVAGQQAGDWVDARVRWFDRVSAGRDGSGGSKRALAKRWAHLAARRVIGTASERTAREVWQAYRQAVERLAREEELRVVVIGSTPFTKAIEDEHRKARSVQTAFNRRLAVLCRERRMGWVDPEQFRHADVDSDYADALHLTPEGHAVVAEAVVGALG